MLPMSNALFLHALNYYLSTRGCARGPRNSFDERLVAEYFNETPEFTQTSSEVTEAELNDLEDRFLELADEEIIVDPADPRNQTKWRTQPKAISLGLEMLSYSPEQQQAKRLLPLSLQELAILKRGQDFLCHFEKTSDGRYAPKHQIAAQFVASLPSELQKSYVLLSSRDSEVLPKTYVDLIKV